MKRKVNIDWTDHGNLGLKNVFPQHTHHKFQEFELGLYVIFKLISRVKDFIDRAQIALKT